MTQRPRETKPTKPRRRAPQDLLAEAEVVERLLSRLVPALADGIVAALEARGVFVALGLPVEEASSPRPGSAQAGDALADDDGESAWSRQEAKRIIEEMRRKR